MDEKNQIELDDDEFLGLLIIMGIIGVIILTIFYWFIMIPLLVVTAIIIYYFKREPKPMSEIDLYRKQAQDFKRDWSEAIRKEKTMRKIKKECLFCLKINSTLQNNECKYCGTKI